MNIVSYTTYLSIPWYYRPWVWGAGALTLLIAGLVIGWLTKPEPLLATLGSPANTSQELDALLAMQNAANNALRNRLASLDVLLTGDVCANPNIQTATVEAIALQGLPTAVQSSGAPGAQKSRQELLSHLEAATVLVKTDSGLGSGFFVNHETVVTNAHVVNGASPSSIRVTNNALKALIPASLLAVSSGNMVGDRDYAILRISGPQAPGTLELSESVGKLDPVIAAGYPGVYLKVWQQQGGGEDIPPLFPRQGEVVYIQEGKPGIPLISHTAEIFHGNSGGPLIDTCGRVIGINTFAYTIPDGAASMASASSVAKVDFAIGAQDLVRFLKSNNITVDVSGETCK